MVDWLKNMLGLVCSDVYGPLEEKSFVNEHNKMMWIDLIHSKYEMWYIQEVQGFSLKWKQQKD